MSTCSHTHTHHHYSQLTCSPRTGAYHVLDADLQPPILYHIDACVWLPWLEDVLPLVQLHEDHVFAELQEERLLEVAQDPRSQDQDKTREEGHSLQVRLGKGVGA